MRTLFSFCLVFALQSLHAQEATTSASGTGQAGNLIFDWSVGELTLVNTIQNGNLILTQGLHQGRLTAFVVGSGIGNGELVVTPNPSPGRVAVKIGFFEPGRLSLRLFDAGGKLLLQSNDAVVTFNTKNIDLTAYLGGLYLLEAVFIPASGSPVRKRTYKILRLL